MKKEAPVATAAAPEAAVKVPEIPPAVSEEVVRMMAEQEERIKRVGALYSELRSAQRDIDRVVGRDLRALHRIAYRRQKRRAIASRVVLSSLPALAKSSPLSWGSPPARRWPGPP